MSNGTAKRKIVRRRMSSAEVRTRSPESLALEALAPATVEETPTGDAPDVMFEAFEAERLRASLTPTGDSWDPTLEHVSVPPPSLRPSAPQSKTLHSPSAAALAPPRGHDEQDEDEHDDATLVYRASRPDVEIPEDPAYAPSTVSAAPHPEHTLETLEDVNPRSRKLAIAVVAAGLFVAAAAGILLVRVAPHAARAASPPVTMVAAGAPSPASPAVSREPPAAVATTATLAPAPSMAETAATVSPAPAKAGAPPKARRAVAAPAAPGEDVGGYVVKHGRPSAQDFHGFEPKN